MTLQQLKMLPMSPCCDSHLVSQGEGWEPSFISVRMGEAPGLLMLLRRGRGRSKPHRKGKKEPFDDEMLEHSGGVKIYIYHKP